MESFGEAFREARITKKLTVREVAEHVGKSIGYLSDVEHNRKRPPKLELVSELEDFLGIEDGKLLRLAAKFRKKVPKEVTNKIRMAPRLSAALLRADADYELTDEQFDEVLDFIKRIGKKGEN